MPHDPYKALYLHLPFCVKRCAYCDFATAAVPAGAPEIEAYVEDLSLQIRRKAKEGELGAVETVYLGGGTPSHVGLAGLSMLLYTLSLSMHLTDEVECTMEANPESLTERMVRDIWALGVNRLSIGVQSFDDDLLKQMDRYEKYGSGDVILERIAEAEPYFDSLNVDMIFNFPSQTEDVLMADLEKIALSGCRQTTFSPLYVSSATTRKMAATLGAMDYDREYRYYQILDGVLAGGDDPLFDRTTLWTFTRPDKEGKPADAPQIDEYQVNYDEYPAIGSGSITHLNGCLYVNNFSIKDYNAAIESGRMSIMGKTEMSKRDLMRYRFLLDLYKLRLDKRAFERDFGCSIETGLPMELAFMRLSRAFETDNADELTLTPIGRYLTVVMYRQFLSGMNNLRDQARAALTGPERELLFGEGVPA